MITIDDKLFITEDVNKIVVSYAKQVVLRKLLTQFSFTYSEEQKNVSELIVAVTIFDLEELVPPVFISSVLVVPLITYVIVVFTVVAEELIGYHNNPVVPISL